MSSCPSSSKPDNLEEIKNSREEYVRNEIRSYIRVALMPFVCGATDDIFVAVDVVAGVDRLGILIEETEKFIATAKEARSKIHENSQK
jgi:hypothetical protein